jgi:hypothetical protein
MMVATMFNMVPITADPIVDRACVGGGGFLFFVFFFCAAIADPVGSGLSTRPGRSPSVLFPIVGCTIARPDTEVLKADGKRRMTASDGLRIPELGVWSDEPSSLRTDTFAQGCDAAHYYTFRANPITKSVDLSITSANTFFDNKESRL